MDGVSAALYVDFDNVVSGLRDHSWEAVQSFVQRPGAWLAALDRDREGRRWLVRRCYVNSAGSISRKGDGSERLEFSSYRRTLMEAGFEVVDCPPFFTRGKNGADIRIAVDVTDDLQAVPASEVVLMTSDSDFTGVLVRVRSTGRRCTLVHTNAASTVLAAQADDVLGLGPFLDLLGASREPERLAQQPVRTPAKKTAGATKAATKKVAAAAATKKSPAAAHRHWGEFVKVAREETAALGVRSGDKVNLAELGTAIPRRLGPELSKDAWFGHSSLTRALTAAKVEI